MHNLSSDLLASAKAIQDVLDNRVSTHLHDLYNMWSGPHVVMRPKVEKVNNEWVATYGDVVGRGESPWQACQMFDKAWFQALKPKEEEVKSVPVYDVGRLWEGGPEV